MRYVCLSMTMVFRVLSPTVQGRFPLMSDLVGAGLLQPNELKIIENLENQYPGLAKNFLPIVWASSIVTKARTQGRIYDDFAVKTLIKELNGFRGKCGYLMAFNSINIPLVYTQVVTIATYFYFLTMVFSQQVLDHNETKTFVFPFVMVMLFIFYMGWLKTAESMLNPFGEDDDDFDLSAILDRNITTAYLIVDDMHNEHPEIVKDQYWDGYPLQMPMNSQSQNPKYNEKDFIDFVSKQKPAKDDLNDNSIIIDGRENDQRRPTVLLNDNVIPDETVIDQRYTQRLNEDMILDQFMLTQNMDRSRRRTLSNANSVAGVAAPSSQSAQSSEDQFVTPSSSLPIRKSSRKSSVSVAKK